MAEQKTHKAKQSRGILESLSGYIENLEFCRNGVIRVCRDRTKRKEKK